MEPAQRHRPVYGPAVSSTLAINSPIKIETVEVSVNLTHTYRGDLQILLTAPSGTQSILAHLVTTPTTT